MNRSENAIRCLPWAASRCWAILLNAPWLSWGSPSFWATVIRQWANAPHKNSAAIRSLPPFVDSSWARLTSSVASCVCSCWFML